MAAIDHIGPNYIDMRWKRCGIEQPDGTLKIGRKMQIRNWRDRFTDENGDTHTEGWTEWRYFNDIAEYDENPHTVEQRLAKHS